MYPRAHIFEFAVEEVFLKGSLNEIRSYLEKALHVIPQEKGRISLFFIPYQ